MTDPLDSYDAFASAVRARLELGAEAYRDRPAAERPLPELVDEMMAEVEDIAGWAACLWPRLRALRDEVALLRLGAHVRTELDAVTERRASRYTSDGEDSD